MLGSGLFRLAMDIKMTLSFSSFRTFRTPGSNLTVEPSESRSVSVPVGLRDGLRKDA